MVQEIRFGSLSANPSDYDCSDGLLSDGLNFKHEDGVVKPSPLPLETLNLSLREIDERLEMSSLDAVYIHTTTHGKNTFFYAPEDNRFVWHDGTDFYQFGRNKTEAFSLDQGETFLHFNAIGNILLCFTDKHIHYLRYVNGSYLYVGTEMPECPISFGLRGRMVKSDTFRVSHDNAHWVSLAEGRLLEDFSEGNKKNYTDEVLSRVNKFIAEESIGNGKFLFPFFVRYAYRLYDDSLIMHSAPILMACSSKIAPVAFVERFNNVVGIENMAASADVCIAAMVHDLDYEIIGDEYRALQYWEGIIKSIDIFISAPIYTYNQSGECTGYSLDDGDSFSVCYHENQDATLDESHPLRYQKKTTRALYGLTFNASNPSDAPSVYVKLPRRSEEAINTDVCECRNFYLLKQIKLENLANGREVIEISEDYLPSLTLRERMTDDFYSHDSLSAGFSYVYNSRLNLARIRKSLFSGFNPASIFTYGDGYIRNFSDVRAPLVTDYTYTVKCRVSVSKDYGTFVVEGGTAVLGGDKDSPVMLYFFHPDPDANTAYIEVYRDQYLTKWYELRLERHKGLNGSYYFNNWNEPERIIYYEGDPSRQTLPPDLSSATSVSMLNKIYVSNTNNPFVFNGIDIKTIGSGDILGMSSSTRAISQGQFGRFPLYAFTTDGVWSLEVNSDGVLSSPQSISRDILANSDAILQTDGSVIFATESGLVELEGSQSRHISDILYSRESPFCIANLPHTADVLIASGGLEIGDGDHDAHYQYMRQSFCDFIQSCRMAYDYRGKRIFVYNTRQSYSYSYSLSGGGWSLIENSFKPKLTLNSYPDCLVAGRDASGASLIVDLGREAQRDSRRSFSIMTRPLKLGGSDVFKTIRTLVVRGYFERGSIGVVLYASRDLMSWHMIGSSSSEYLGNISGSPYKYFRIVLVSNKMLSSNHSVSGVSVEFVARDMNKLR